MMLSMRIATLVMMLGLASAAPAQVQKFKFSVFTPDKEQTFITTMKPFAEAVNKESGGTC